MNSISLLRTKLQMTQYEFAEFCDISVVSISRYEAGKNISRKNAKKIARACQVSVDYVLNLPVRTDSVDDKENQYITLSPEEREQIRDYRRLSKRGQKRIRETMDEMLRLYPSSSKE